MNINELNSKIWYRTVKVFFIVSFIATQIFTIFFIFLITDDQKIITSESYTKIGSIIKNQYPIYSDLSNEEVGQLIYEKRYDLWSNYNDLITYKDKYSFGTKIAYYILSVLAVSIIFWLISKTFHYIVTGKFLN